MLQVRENEISQRKWSIGTARLRTLEGILPEILSHPETSTYVDNWIKFGCVMVQVKLQILMKFLKTRVNAWLQNICSATWMN